jgi:hypothetical protein
MMKAVRSSARFSVIAAALAFSLAASGARADDAQDLRRARERFKEGAALQAAGDFARALEAYKEVAQIKSTAQVRFNIATCEEKTGDYIRAVGSYRLALTEATKSNSKDIEKAVHSALADLEPRIPMLLVKRGEGAGVAEVTLDGRALANPSIGVEFPVNPGPHALAASAPDRLPFSGEVTLADRDHKAITVVLKPKPAPIVATPDPDAGKKDTPPDTPPPETGNRKLKIAGFTVGGLGLVSLGISGAFFGLRQSAISKLNADCGASHMSCPAGDNATYSSGQTDATVSAALFVTGLVLAGSGAIMLGVSSRKPKAPPPPEASLVLTPNGAGLRGTF